VGWSQMGLNRRPFGLTADTDAYVASPPAEAAMQTLRTAFDRREGFALVDGVAGVGKTFTVLSWLERLERSVPRVWLPNTHSSRPADLLQAILFDLNEPYQGLAEQELRLAVTNRLLDALRNGQPLVIVIDEAQHLGAAALEELRLLSNVDSRFGKGLFAVLIGQPGLRESLKQPAYEAFAQRVTTRLELTSLADAESRDYLDQHIRRAGGKLERVLTEEAVDLLIANGNGLPRRLSLIAGLAFDIALAGEADGVDVEVVLEALEQLGFAPPAEETIPLVKAKLPVVKPKSGRRRSA